MTTLVLDEEQARVVRSSKFGEIKDPSGNVIGKFVPDDLEEDLRIAKERLANPGKTYTTEQVLEHLKSLASE